MNRLDWYYRQKVSEAELDLLQTNIEQAIANTVLDLFAVGWITGANLSPAGGMTVQITAGRGYDEQGQRIFIPSTQIVDLTPYCPTAAGRERWVLVAGRFKRVYSDPRTDGYGNTVYFRQDESFEIVCRPGAEANTGAATKPPKQAGDVIIGYVRVYYGQTSVAAGDISTAEREQMSAHPASQISIADAGNRYAASNVEDALQEVAANLSAHAARTDNPHGTTAAQVGALTSVDGVANPGGNVDLQAGPNIAITPDNTNKRITIAVSPQGSGSGLGADTLDGYHADTGTAPNTIPVRDASGKLLGSITGDSDTVDGKHATDAAGQLAVYDSNRRVYDSNRLAGMTPATGSVANSIAQRDASGDLTARVLRSDVATGTPPLVVASSTTVANLNADMVDGKHAADLVQNAGGVPEIQAGDDASKPAPGTPGRIYIATDTQRIYRDTGSAWQLVGVVNWADVAGKPAVATLNENGRVVQRLAYEGVAGGVATLGNDGRVPTSQLPSSLALPYYQPGGALLVASDTLRSAYGQWRYTKQLLVRGYGVVRVYFEISAQGNTPYCTQASVRYGDDPNDIYVVTRGGGWAGYSADLPVYGYTIICVTLGPSWYQGSDYTSDAWGHIRNVRVYGTEASPPSSHVVLVD